MAHATLMVETVVEMMSILTIVRCVNALKMKAKVNEYLNRTLITIQKNKIEISFSLNGYVKYRNRAIRTTAFY